MQQEGCNEKWVGEKKRVLELLKRVSYTISFGYWLNLLFSDGLKQFCFKLYHNVTSFPPLDFSGTFKRDILTLFFSFLSTAKSPDHQNTGKRLYILRPLSLK